MKCPECGAAVRWQGDVTQMDCPYCQASITKSAPPAPPTPVVPPDPIRAMLEDKDGNGVPDIFEGMGQGSAVNITTTTRVESMFIVNGVQYKSLDEMPANVRTQFEQITHTLGSGDMFALPKAIEGSRSATMPHDDRPPGAVTAVKKVVKGKPSTGTNAQNAAAADAQEKSPLNIAIYAVLGVIVLFVIAGIAVWFVDAAR